MVPEVNHTKPFVRQRRYPELNILKLVEDIAFRKDCSLFYNGPFNGIMLFGGDYLNFQKILLTI
jgi:hypothetical protein